MVDIKDFVLDRFGVLDDVRDFADFLAKSTREFRVKSTLVEKLVSEARSAIESATSVAELKRLDLGDAFALLRSTQRDIADVISRMRRVEAKGRRDPAIWSRVQSDFTAARSAMESFALKVKTSVDELVLYQREQKQVLREMERGGIGDETQALKRPLSSRLGRLVGITAGVLASLALITFAGARG